MFGAVLTVTVTVVTSPRPSLVEGYTLYVLMYARLQIFIQLSPTLTKLCHIASHNAD